MSSIMMPALELPTERDLVYRDLLMAWCGSALGAVWLRVVVPPWPTGLTTALGWILLSTCLGCVAAWSLSRLGGNPLRPAWRRRRPLAVVPVVAPLAAFLAHVLLCVALLPELPLVARVLLIGTLTALFLPELFLVLLDRGDAIAPGRFPIKLPGLGSRLAITTIAGAAGILLALRYALLLEADALLLVSTVLLAHLASLGVALKRLQHRGHQLLIASGGRGRDELSAWELLLQEQQGLRDHIGFVRSHWRSLLEAQVDAVVLCDPKGVILTLNRAAEQLCGFALTEAAGRPFPALFGLNEGGEAKPINRLEDGRCRWRMRNVADEMRSLELHVGDVNLPDGRLDGRIYILRDITAEERLGQELRQAQQHGAVAEMAGDLAREFNNLLASVVSNGEYVLKQMTDDQSRPRRHVQAILQTADRANSLNQRLQSLVRGQQQHDGSVTRIDLHETVSDTIDMLRRTFDRRITVSTSLLANQHQLRADPSDLTTLLTNLCVNARDAMPDGGSIRVLTTDAEILHANEPPLCCLTVSDTGVGISAAMIGRIFDPLFSTKGDAHGSGLGLTTVRRIVQDLGGTITVDSKVGQGSSFVIRLPVLPELSETSSGSSSSQRPAISRVLVVEDEDILRDILASQVRELGHVVEVAADGTEALERLRQEPAPQLILLDLNLPRTDGHTVINILAEQRPELPIIVVSGHLGSSSMDHPNIMGRLAKPFRRETLKQVIDRALRQIESDGK